MLVKLNFVALGIFERSDAAIRILCGFFVGAFCAGPHSLEDFVDIIDFKDNAGTTSGGPAEKVFGHERKPMIVARVKLDQLRLGFIGMDAIYFEA